jgi:hypothetical protein
MRVPGLHASAGRRADQQAADAPRWLPCQADAQPIDWAAARSASRSCCCPAAPAVVAVMPPVPDRRHRTEILLCMHHFRTSRAALSAAGAAVYRLDGEPVAATAPAYLGSGERGAG